MAISLSNPYPWPQDSRALLSFKSIPKGSSASFGKKVLKPGIWLPLCSKSSAHHELEAGGGDAPAVILSNGITATDLMIRAAVDMEATFVASLFLVALEK